MIYNFGVPKDSDLEPHYRMAKANGNCAAKYCVNWSRDFVNLSDFELSSLPDCIGT